MTGKNTSTVVPLVRGEEYRKLYQGFLRQGTLSAQANNYVIVKRLVLEGPQNSYAYGIGCMRCGKLSWDAEMSQTVLPRCRTFHDPN